MFTASIQKTNFNEGSLQVLVEFSNGTETFFKALNVNSEADLKRQIRNEQVRLDELSTLSKTLVNGAYDPSDAPTPQESSEDRDKRNWFRNFSRLESLTRLKNLGALRPALETDLEELKTTVSNDFKKAYIADM